MDECIFCNIVSGKAPSYKLYEDEHSLAFLDIFPVHSGHTLVIPKSHVPTIFDVSVDDWKAVSATVHKIAPALEKALSADGINIMMNNREHAGQVVHHAHVHLIPRFKGDGLALWPHDAYKEGEAENVQSRITEAL